MALATSGALSLNEIHVEAGGTSGTTCSLNDTDIRGLTAASGRTINSTQGTNIDFADFYGATSIIFEATGLTASYSKGVTQTTSGKTTTTTHHNHYIQMNGNTSALTANDSNTYTYFLHGGEQSDSDTSVDNFLGSLGSGAATYDAISKPSWQTIYTVANGTRSSNVYWQYHHYGRSPAQATDPTGSNYVSTWYPAYVNVTHSVPTGWSSIDFEFTKSGYNSGDKTFTVNRSDHSSTGSADWTFILQIAGGTAPTGGGAYITSYFNTSVDVIDFMGVGNTTSYRNSVNQAGNISSANAKVTINP